MAKITKPTTNKQTWGKTGPHSLLVGKKLMAATGNIGVENSLDVKRKLPLDQLYHLWHMPRRLNLP